MPEKIKTKVVGVSRPNENGRSRQEIIEEEVSDGDDLTLQREPENTHDENAIAVYPGLHFDGDDTDDRIGYLNADLASRLAPMIDQGQHIDCRVINITSGEGGKTIGVNVELIVFSVEETEEMLKKFRAKTPLNIETPIQETRSATAAIPAPQPRPISSNPTKKPHDEGNFLYQILSSFIKWYGGLFPKRGVWVQLGFIFLNVLICSAIAMFLGGDLGSASTPTEVPVTIETAVVLAQTQAAAEAAFFTPSPTTIKQSSSGAKFIKTYDTNQAAYAIQKAGLEFVDPAPMTKDDYGMAPMNAQEAIRFYTPSVCSDCSGRLYSFLSPIDLAYMDKYYTELGRQSAILYSWVFIHDNILIQLNGDMPEDQALKYKASLEALR